MIAKNCLKNAFLLLLSQNLKNSHEYYTFLDAIFPGASFVKEAALATFAENTRK